MTDDGRRHQLARSFGSVAAMYERGRPPYPEAGLDWLLPPGARRVLDLGAGTGKLTRQLAGRGLDVTAVEPSPGMREEFGRVLPGVPVAGGSAEDIPFGDSSFDAVLMAQAWHWVDPVTAAPEVARVLRPGGWLGLLWNVRDERAGWVARLSEIMRDRETEQGSVKYEPTIGAPFDQVERREVEWEFRLPAGALTDYVASRSYVITMPESEREATLTAVRELLATDPALAGAAEIGLPQVTLCYRASVTP